MSKTDENLKAAVAAESLARNRYSYFAEIAKKEGYRYIAKIFAEIAENEKYHALEELRLLMGDRDTLTNLKESVNGEQYESEDMYPRFATEAEVEGNRFSTQICQGQHLHTHPVCDLSGSKISGCECRCRYQSDNYRWVENFLGFCQGTGTGG